MANRDEGMNHPEEGMIQALLDGEVERTEEEALRTHLEGCSTCHGTMEALADAGAVTIRALGLLDVPPDMEGARDRFRERRQAPGGEGIPLDGSASWWSRIPLARAASIALLLTGAAVSALPGSPVRRWMAEGWTAITGGEDQEVVLENAAPVTETPTSTLTAEARETGTTLPAGEDGVELWIDGLPTGAQVRVLWIKDGQPGIYAGEGTRYRRQDNRLDAQSPPGSVRVEIPRSLTRAVVSVNGFVVLRLTPEGVELARPVESSSDTEILFSPFRGG